MSINTKAARRMAPAMAAVAGLLAPMMNQAQAQEGVMSVAAMSSAFAQETERNRVSVEHFADLFYHQRKVLEAFETYVSDSRYIQHNPNMPDGREAAITMLEPKFTAPGFHAKVQRIVVDGSMAVIHIAVGMQPGKYTAAVADIYRFDGGKIVEHWDVLQPIPENPKSPHPMF